MKKHGVIYVRIDYKNSGIGSGSCGPELAPEYGIPEQMRFSVTFSVLHK